MKKTSSVVIAALCFLLLLSGLGLLWLKNIPVFTPVPENSSGGEQTEILQPPVTSLRMIVENGRELESMVIPETLKELDLSGSTCYDDIDRFSAGHPGIEVTYTVFLQGVKSSLTLTNGAESAVIPDGSLLPELTENAAHLKLNTVRITDSAFTPEEYAAFREAFPRTEILFDFCSSISGISPMAEALDLTELMPEDTENAAGFLRVMPQLTNVRLTDENGENRLELAETLPLQQAAAQAVFDYRFWLFGRELNLSDESEEFYGNQTGAVGNDGLNTLEELLPCLTRLKSLYFEYCSIDYDRLAEFRDAHPEINTVWRVNFGPYSCRTDREMIFANGSLTDETVYNLRYCNKVKYIDLGHNENVTQIEFVRFMPDLEVGIFAVTGLRDISPLAGCTKLRYLEIFTSSVWDLSPLAACAALEHLNVSYIPANDISPLYGLTNLKRFWCTCSNVPYGQREEIQALLPDCTFCFAYVEPTGNHWRFNDDGSRVEPYEEIAGIFGYDNWRDYITYW